MPDSRGAATRILSQLAVAALVMLLACHPSDASSQNRGAPRSDVADEAMGALPRDIVAIRLDAPKEFVENSGITMSVRQPGILFTINDSGNDALLFAFDTTGAGRGVWRVDGARNADWEAIAIARCAPRVTPPDGAATDSATAGENSCVYIGDVGDNSAERATRAIYRLEEPAARKKGSTGKVTASRLTFTYEDGPHDVEAMYVAPDGDVVLITKRPLADESRGLRPALVFTLPYSAWLGAQPAVARLVDSLPITPGSAPLRQITDAALAPDARHLAVRTYAEVYVFATDSATGRVVHAVPPATCNVSGLAQEQGEGIAWHGTSNRLLLTSEGRKSPMLVVGCPLPDR